MTTQVEGLRLEVVDAVAWLTLDRPDKLNSLSHEMMDGLPLLLRELGETRAVRALVLRGAGRAFCAGGDVRTALDTAGLSRADLVARFQRRQQAAELLHTIPKPTLAVVHGVAAGAGLSLALACDLRLASPSARFGTAFIKVGFSGDYGASWLLPRLVGVAHARELMFSGDVIDADRAASIGLVNRVVPDTELAEKAQELATKLASAPPLAVARMKRTMNRAVDSSFPEALAEEAEGTVAMLETEDNREGMRAFMDRRPPVFQGR